jgi:hypothetical protein
VPGETPGAVAASADTRTSLRSNGPAWAALHSLCCGWCWTRQAQRRQGHYPVRGVAGVRTVEFREELALTATGKVLRDQR